MKVGTLTLVLLAVAGASWGADSSKEANPAGSADPTLHATKNREIMEMITPCPSTPNCVSSVDTDPKHFVQPLRFQGTTENAKKRLKSVLNRLKRTRVVKEEGNMLEAESVSALMRFVDDLTFFIDEKAQVIHLKSASRKGQWDLGVNRRRVEKIRDLFEKEI